jgi:hypothetical protein
VISNVDVGRLELHQRIKVIIDGIDGLPFQRGKDLEGDQGIFSLFDMINYFHEWFNWLQTYDRKSGWQIAVKFRHTKGICNGMSIFVQITNT